jgi:hypothetical protein
VRAPDGNETLNDFGHPPRANSRLARPTDPAWPTELCAFRIGSAVARCTATFCTWTMWEGWGLHSAHWPHSRASS